MAAVINSFPASEIRMAHPLRQSTPSDSDGVMIMLE